MNTFKYLLIALLGFVLLSCHSRKDDEKDADARLTKIEQLVKENSFNAAKVEIDSVHQLYPRLVEKRKLAAAFYDTIVRRESSRTLNYCDTVLLRKNKELATLIKNFRLEKNEKYQDVGNYIYKTQITEINTTRNYLKVYVDENSDLYLVSNYTGQKLEHVAIKASVGELYAASDTLSTSDPAFHSFTDDGTRWETLTLKNEAAKPVALFIAQYVDSPVKITLVGAKSSVQYVLTALDKKAIAETYSLWIAKTDIAQLQMEIKKAKAKINRINHYKSKK